MSTGEKQAIEKYNKLKSEYQEILKRYVELEQQRRQNNLVLNNIEPLHGENRKCWKIVGGVLVQYTMQETVDSLKQNIAMLEQALKALDAEMAKREKQVLDIQLKYNLNPNKKQQQLTNQKAQQSGLLA